MLADDPFKNTSNFIGKHQGIKKRKISGLLSLFNRTQLYTDYYFLLELG